ncbi:MAG: hypothetical protein IPL59_17605 [Candidatus Competibacteraceae bacterium]|nr:hypothetical protein [Candidatus Competibacteraceae bacterium]
MRLQKLAAPLTEMECVSPDKKISSDITELHGKAEKISSNNNLLGHFDGIGECCATGWAFDKAAPQKPVSVQIIAEGRVIAQTKLPISAQISKISELVSVSRFLQGIFTRIRVAA